jgi:hypothetical protein
MLKGILYLVLGLLLISSCRKEEYYTGGDVNLRFSSDTITFDTVFTEIGSATKVLKIYNDNDKPVLIDVELKNLQSFFRINVNGTAGFKVPEVEIRANDSIYVFAEVTIDPNEPLSISPFIIGDVLNVNFNGNNKTVQLEAWGQNANYIPLNRKFNFEEINICEGMSQIVWDDPKPYVIYGIAYVDGCELVIPAGTQIYVHGGFNQIEGSYFNAGIILISNQGKITCQGTLENPVLIQGDRLEEEYDNVPGQWSGVRLLAESKGNTFNYTTIKNSIIGLRVDSLAEVSMKNCQIFNTASSGLLSVYGNTNVENSLFYNNAVNAAQISFGGNHDFKFCTFANYLNDMPAVNLDNYLCLDQPFCSEALVAPLNAKFTNCIITGSNEDELWMIDRTQGEPGFFNYTFDHCILKVKNLIDGDNFPAFFENCSYCDNYQSGDLLFLDEDNEDFHLDSLSIADKTARPLSAIPLDLEGVFRDIATPDVGCYERID